MMNVCIRGPCFKHLGFDNKKQVPGIFCKTKAKTIKCNQKSNYKVVAKSNFDNFESSEGSDVEAALVRMTEQLKSYEQNSVSIYQQFLQKQNEMEEKLKKLTEQNVKAPESNHSTAQNQSTEIPLQKFQDFSSLTQNLTNVYNKVLDLEVYMKEKSNQYSNQKDVLDTLQDIQTRQTNDKLQNEIEELKQTVNFLKGELQVSANTIEKPLAVVDELKEIINELQEKLQEQTSIVVELNANLNQNSQTIEDLDQKIRNLEEQLQEKTRQIDQLCFEQSVIQEFLKIQKIQQEKNF
eukprot:TRINITY_DN14341_c0_g1_i2.p1 TRINITY_DN14341_c0_g1~~TRINITY_DN14341_c0_g1_i2.p1  ORF type:complete len:294 (+),score=21.83 TRINITY_DN14341_c0_g1_i2:411-1292(+)